METIFIQIWFYIWDSSESGFFIGSNGGSNMGKRDVDHSLQSRWRQEEQCDKTELKRKEELRKVSRAKKQLLIRKKWLDITI